MIRVDFGFLKYKAFAFPLSSRIILIINTNNFSYSHCFIFHFLNFASKYLPISPLSIFKMSTFSKVALLALLAVASAAPLTTTTTTTTNSTTITVVKSGPEVKANVPAIKNWGNLGLPQAPTVQPFHVEYVPFPVTMHLSCKHLLTLLCSSKNASAHLAADINQGIIIATDLESKDNADKKQLSDIQKQEKELHEKEKKIKADEKATAGKEKDAKHHVAGLIEEFKAKHKVDLKHLIMPAIKDKNTTDVVKKIYQHITTNKVVDVKNKNGTSSHTVTKESEEFKEIMTKTTHGIIAGKLGQPESILISTTETEDKKIQADGSYTLSFSYVQVTKITDITPSNSTLKHDHHRENKHAKF